MRFRPLIYPIERNASLVNVSWSDFALRDLKQFSAPEAKALKIQIEDILKFLPLDAGETVHIPYDNDYIVICHRYAHPAVTSVLRILFYEDVVDYL